MFWFAAPRRKFRTRGVFELIVNSYDFGGNPQSIFSGYCLPIQKWRQLRGKSRPSFEFGMIGFFSGAMEYRNFHDIFAGYIHVSDFDKF